MVVLVALAERRVGRLGVDLIDKGPASWAMSAGKARGDEGGAEILCLGSSLTKFGVHPAVISRATGRTSYNLGVYGGRVASSYYLLAHAIESGHRPKAVILDGYEGPVPAVPPASPTQDLRTLHRYWVELLNLRERFDLAWQAGDGEFFGLTLVAWALPSVRNRLDLRALVRDTALEEQDIVRGSRLTVLRNWNANLGAQVMPTDVPMGDDELAHASPAHPARDHWSNHRLLEVYARRLLRLARANGVRVFWVLPPLTEPVMRAQVMSGFDDLYVRFMHGLQAEFPDLVVIDGRDSGYGPSLFFDPTHLNEAGMLAFSGEVGAVVDRSLKQDGGPSVWAVVPSYRPGSWAGTVENLSQSKVALSAPKALR